MEMAIALLDGTVDPCGGAICRRFRAKRHDGGESPVGGHAKAVAAESFGQRMGQVKAVQRQDGALLRFDPIDILGMAVVRHGEYPKSIGLQQQQRIDHHHPGISRGRGKHEWNSEAESFGVGDYIACKMLRRDDRFGWGADCPLFPSPFALNESKGKADHREVSSLCSVEGPSTPPAASFRTGFDFAQPERMWVVRHWPKAAIGPGLFANDINPFRSGLG